jgi:hypothetical protein
LKVSADQSSSPLATLQPKLPVWLRLCATARKASFPEGSVPKGALVATAAAPGLGASCENGVSRGKVVMLIPASVESFYEPWSPRTPLSELCALDLLREDTPEPNPPFLELFIPGFVPAVVNHDAFAVA